VVEPLDLLFEAPGLPAFDLPAELGDVYGGSLGFEEPCFYTNFVSTIDGVVAIPYLDQSSKLVSGDSETDRFVMGLLRACADVVLIGSGTLRASPRSLWTAQRVYPAAGAAFAELRRRLGRPPEPELAVLTVRRRLGRPPEPELAVLTGTGSIDPAHPAIAAGAVVLTTERGAAALHGRLPASATAIALGPEDTPDPRAAVDALHARGHRLILSEAGPHVFGSLLEAGVVDELFLTLSPLLGGRPAAGERLALVEGAEFLPAEAVAGRLTSIRRQKAHLFIRYRLEESAGD